MLRRESSSRAKHRLCFPNSSRPNESAYNRSLRVTPRSQTKPGLVARQHKDPSEPFTRSNFTADFKRFPFDRSHNETHPSNYLFSPLGQNAVHPSITSNFLLLDESGKTRKPGETVACLLSRRWSEEIDKKTTGEIRFIGFFETLGSSCPLLFVEAAREFYRRP